VTDGTFFFRVIQRADDAWTCRRGRDDIDHHDTLEDAVDHVTSLASLHRPSEVLVHHRDGRVESAARLL
jgi:hypothetical protein